MMGEAETFDEYLRRRQPYLLRVAFLLTGDAYGAQDLVQSALMRVLPHWDRIGRMENVDAYACRVLVRVHASWRRRRWWGEIPHVADPDRDPAKIDDENDRVDKVVLLNALAKLPARQRAVIVLRFYLDFSEQRTADALGCRVGTVKSQTSKALATLRRIVPTLWSENAATPAMPREAS
jgi:RNA polymerase sigma-70 factor (sigma-E family)